MSLINHQAKTAVMATEIASNSENVNRREFMIRNTSSEGHGKCYKYINVCLGKDRSDGRPWVVIYLWQTRSVKGGKVYR